MRLDAAKDYLNRNIKITLCRGKDPIGRAWGKKVWTIANVEKAFAKNPSLNVGAIMGRINGFLDIECDENEDVFAELFEGCEVPKTPTFQSQRGPHRIFQLAPELDSIRKAKIKWRDLEIHLGNDGKQSQTVWPPSINEDGTARKWLITLDEATPAKLPQLVIDRILSEQSKPRTTSDGPILEKTRHETLKSGACAERTRGANDEQVLAWLTDTNRERCKPPLEDSEVAGLARYVCQLERGNRTYRAALPEIKITLDEQGTNDQIIEALADCENLYVRGRSLVEILESPPPPRNVTRPQGGIYAVEIEAPRLRERISSSATFLKGKQTDEGWDWIPNGVPANSVSQVLGRGKWNGIPTLEGVVTCPQFLPNGAILNKPGYDAGSGLFFAPEIAFPALPEPTKDNAILAGKQLLEVFEDFPLSDEGKSGLVSIVVTGVARFAIDGCTPLFAADANSSACGKNKAMDATSTIVTGRELARTTIPTSEGEFGKKITSILLACEPMQLLDNIDVPLGGPNLESLLTGRTWTDRLLGVSKMTTALPNNTLWLATGNNLVFKADTARRALRIRMVTDLENPETRKDFKHSNLLGWVQENRARLTNAALTILEAFHEAGRPDMGVDAWGSFEAWSSLIRNALLFAGLEDPAKSRQAETSSSDSKNQTLRAVITTLKEFDPNGEGFTVRRLMEIAGFSDNTAIRANGNSEMAALLSVIQETGGKPSATVIGAKLGKFRDCVCGVDRLVGPEVNGTRVWRVQKAADRLPK